MRTSHLGHNLSWTMGRQLASFDGITYTYDENGIRTSKTSNGVTTKYYLKGSNIIYQTDGTDALYFFYDSKDNIVGFNYADNDYFYVKNKQGDITDITDSNGEVVASYTYDPWGKVVSVVGDETIGNLNPFRYRSYYYDSDIKMYYLQSRYYDPEVFRFINCDDVNFIGLTESEVSYNPFAYCGNDPVNHSDEKGNYFVSKFAKNWLISLINKLLKKTEINNEYPLIEFDRSQLKLGLYLICSKSISIKSYKPFYINKGSLTMNFKKFSVTLSGGSKPISTSFTMMNTTVRIALHLASNSIGFVVSFLQSVKYKVKKDVYWTFSVGLKLLLKISYIAFATMAVTVIAATCLAPQIAPFMTKIASTLVSLKANTGALIPVAQTLVRAIRVLV